MPSKLRQTLHDPALLENRAYYAGKWHSGDKTFAVTNPSDGSEIAQVADLTADDMHLAVDAAYEAQKSWAARTALDRCEMLLKWQSLILEHIDDLAKILTAEMGKPFTESKGEIRYGASFIQWFAEEGRRVYGDVIPSAQSNNRIIVLKQPVGVAGAITPWNFPMAMIARKVGPALAAGCTFVSRPAEKTPLSALAMAVLAERAGIPQGVLNIVTGQDAPSLGKALCTSSKVRKLTFTGSTATGSILMQQCAHDIKKLSLELGGNAPFIVFEDANLEQAVQGALVAKYRNSGQTCVCANRLYVHQKVADAFAAKLVQATEALRVGDGMEDSTQVGPLIDQTALTKVEEHVRDAVSKGAKVLTGGKPSSRGGTYYQPTVLMNVQKGMKILEEETFGPVAPIITFDTTEQVIAMANDTPFGLASYLYTRDINRVWRVAEALEYGMVGINTGLVSAVEAPFGGIKSSGLGREGSKYGIDDFLEIKYLCMNIA